LKKLMIITAMLALLALVAIPAIAQVGGGVGQDSESGDVTLSDTVGNTGNYAMQCTPASQFGNTGNFNNGQSFVQYASEADDFKPGGIEFSAAPVVTTDCAQQVQQSSSASG
jgi:hypothetical protein